jgi:hypothetical protein
VTNSKKSGSSVKFSGFRKEKGMDFSREDREGSEGSRRDEWRGCRVSPLLALKKLDRDYPSVKLAG